MPDRKKVIHALECLSLKSEIKAGRSICDECAYEEASESFIDCVHRVSADALELLKEQEPVEPWKVKRYIQYNNTAVDFPDTYNCGNCGKELPDNAKYCPVCGKKVKWDE